MKRACAMCDGKTVVRAEVIRTAGAVKSVCVILCPVCDTRTCAHCGKHVSDRTADRCPNCNRSLSLTKK